MKRRGEISLHKHFKYYISWLLVYFYDERPPCVPFSSLKAEWSGVNALAGVLLKHNLAWYVFKLGNTWLIFDMLIFVNFRRIQKYELLNLNINISGNFSVKNNCDISKSKQCTFVHQPKFKPPTCNHQTITQVHIADFSLLMSFFWVKSSKPSTS